MRVLQLKVDIVTRGCWFFRLQRFPIKWYVYFDRKTEKQTTLWGTFGAGKISNLWWQCPSLMKSPFVCTSVSLTICPVGSCELNASIKGWILKTRSHMSSPPSMSWHGLSNILNKKLFLHCVEADAMSRRNVHDTITKSSIQHTCEGRDHEVL